jgi:hypothetical protein
MEIALNFWTFFVHVLKRSHVGPTGCDRRATKAGEKNQPDEVQVKCVVIYGAGLVMFRS